MTNNGTIENEHDLSDHKKMQAEDITTLNLT